MNEPCALGDIEFDWQPNDPLASLVDGHGVEVDGADVGIIDRATATITGKSATTPVEPGVRVRHSAELCASGRRRYSA
jgi:hypothetical protein